jgi:DNA mismatch repair protein MutS2
VLCATSNDYDALSTAAAQATGRGGARAGKDGYSLTRQPLQRGTWDATIDPTFQAPKSLEETSNHKIDMDWWSSKNRQQRTTNNHDITQATTTKGGTNDNSINNDIITSANTLNLFQRTFDTLDFPTVLRALQRECFTIPAKQIIEKSITQEERRESSTGKKNNNNDQTKSATTILANDPQTVQRQYRAVQEMQWLLETNTYQVNVGDAYYKNRRGYQVTIGNGNPPPLEGLLFDLESIIQIIEDGQILEGPELLDVSVMMNAIEDLQLWSKGLERSTVTLMNKYNNYDAYEMDDDFEPSSATTESFVELPAIINGIQLNTTLQALLEDAFDDNGKLSGKTFPVLGQLRAKVRTLKSDILKTLDTIVSLPSIKSKLALESGGPLVSEVSSAGGGGRLVLPINPKYASDLGIVHDSSRSGKTVYVEPSEIVGPTNELRQIEHELETEEAGVWRLLTEQVWNNRRDLQASVKAVAQLDLCVARCTLGQRLHGVIPVVKNEGVIFLKDAKHPVLSLRKVNEVVGNEISLGVDGNQGLVLTGPNSGGKTGM